MGGNPDIQQDPVHSPNPKAEEHLPHSGEIGTHHRRGQPPQVRRRLFHGVGILIQGDQPPVFQSGGDGKGMSAPSRRAVEIRPVRPDIQGGQRFLQQDRAVIAADRLLHLPSSRNQNPSSMNSASTSSEVMAPMSSSYAAGFQISARLPAPITSASFCRSA